MIQEIKNNFPKYFQYQLLMDEDVSGRFEVNIHKKSDCLDEGELVHSKVARVQFPNDDFPTFIELIKQAIE